MQELFWCTTVIFNNVKKQIYSLKSDMMLVLVFVISHTERKERNALFNDALNTFYLRLYGVRPFR